MNKKQNLSWLGILLFALCGVSLSQDKTPVYFAPDPGHAMAQADSKVITLSNKVLRMNWQVVNGSFLPGKFEELLGHRYLPAPKTVFVLVLGDGRVLSSGGLKLIGSPMVQPLKPVPTASRLSHRIPGQAVVVHMQDADGTVQVEWRGILRDGDNYVRQEITISANKVDVPTAEIRLVDWQLPDAKVIGTVKGAPVASGDVFIGFEHPLSTCSVSLGRARCKIARELPLRAGKSVTYSNVIGVSPQGQLRRAFLRYVERERAHPYRTFLHYNSWYDLGYFSKFDETGALAVVRAFGDELHLKRNVALDSYLFDDGWDDPSTLWHFNSGFPQGLTNVRIAAEQYGAEPGIWMSPWGGYGKPKQMRVEAARADGFQIANGGLALSDPNYYKLFRDTCLRMIRDFGVNQFKFDGTGNADSVVPGSEFDSDFDAAIHLIGELRTEKPDLYVNLTTGTYPSPFWLQYADSIWRGGEDHSFLGEGTNRQRWITYRDADTYEHIVMEGPLYPLNSLMLHGLIFAKHAKGLDSDPADDFRTEVRDYFGSGTQLQEMYISPSLLSQQNWDDLAEAAKWSRANADVLVDTHWVGGDPAQAEIYGWASWEPRKGILVLRNPSARPQSISLKLAEVFELPAGLAQEFRMRSPWKDASEGSSFVLASGQTHCFALKPFEVLVLGASPVNHYKP